MKEGYSQQELLLLSNFVYIPACLSDRPIREVIDAYRDESGGFSEESVAGAAAGGGMSCKDVSIVFTEMDKVIQKDEGFGELSASRRLEDPTVRAVCYTDKKDDNPVVVFRGTGGTKEAWSDNFEGAYLEETRIQHLADEFVKNECSLYGDIVVTGHSKGGNLAQYVTVRENSMVRECISFDGQGFGDDFIAACPGDIKKASPKICSVSAYNDFVNILLVSIAGRCIYVANDPSLAGAHSPTTLLTNNTFDEDGNFISLRPQSPVCAQLGALTDRITRRLDPFPVRDKEAMSKTAGIAVSGALSGGTDKLFENSVAPALGTAAGEVKKRAAAIKRLMHENEELAAQNVYIDTRMLGLAAVDVMASSAKIKKVMSRVDGIRQDLAYSLSAKICAEHSLLRSMDDLEGICERLERYSDVLSGVIRCYEYSESRALSLIAI